MILCVPTGAVEDTGRDIVEEQGTLKAGGMEEQGIWLSFCAAICCSSNNCKFARKTSMLMFIKYWARATDSLFPVILIVRSKFAGASRSSQLEIRIIAPESCLISATFDPPFPIMHPMSSFGTVISCVCCWAGDLVWPDSTARAAGLIIPFPRGFPPLIALIGRPTFASCAWEIVWLCTIACEGWNSWGRLFTPPDKLATVTALRGVYGTVTPFGGDSDMITHIW